MMRANLILLTFVSAFALSGCGIFKEKDAPPLEGKRISLFEMEKSISGDKSTDTVSGAHGPDTGMQIPAPWANEFWPQPGGYANHAMQNVALNEGELKKTWSSSIGSGATKRLPLSTQPIVADGRVFTLDTDARVRAFDAKTGRSVWTVKAMPKSEDDPVLGGGVAFSGGRLFVTSGFNEVLALNPVDGSELWRVKVEGTVRSSPSAMPERVYVVTVDNQTIALDAATGKKLWNHQGLTETTGLLGAASPAANRNMVLPAYSSGEVYALQSETGSVLWSDTVAPLIRGGMGSAFSDIRGLPVIDQGLVVAISYGGRIAAIDERTGQRSWDANIGGSQTPLFVGNRIFVLGSDSAITSLDAATGQTMWSTRLPQYEDMKDLEGSIVWYGPVLAGNRLLAFSSTGLGRDIDPKTGNVTREWKTGQNVIAPPVVADQTLYLLSKNGTLSAWR
jgi:outer membrane protein assembly factor BamB